MDIQFKKQFLKDLSKIQKEYKEKIELIVFNKSLETNGIINKSSKMVGYKNFYKIRVGPYRIGIYYNKTKLEFIRVLHRKEIYKIFP